jgi:subtilase family serine protease
MPAFQRTRRLIILASAGVLATTGAALAAPAHAASTSGPSRSVTVILKAPNLAGLNRLAAAHGLSRAKRLSALSRLLPSDSTRSTVTRVLRSEGLKVDSQSAWSLTASGPASAVTHAFGTRPTLGAHPTLSRYLAATGALPNLPASLSAVVSGVYPTTGGPSPFHHAATAALKGTDFRNADTPAHVAPSTGQHDAGTTVATLQLANFNSSDITKYAAEQTPKLPNAVADGQYKAVKVDGGATSTDGDVEVDLDQESILSTAPTANQHAYFAPNTDAGFDDVFSHVLDDVVANKFATAPDKHITALSSSWGECEAETGAASINALEPILKSLTAAGVTVFASSGDDGIYDCGSLTGGGLDNHQADVDYPASSPEVVGAGGSNLSAAKSAPNTGTNWKETVWTCTSAVSCESAAGTGGGGGGESGSAFGSLPPGSTTAANFKGFAAPAYQKTAIKDKPFAGATKRLVPDISADADPATGFVLYTSDAETVAECGGNDCQFGGTSLASPISAAQLDNTLADAGHKTGVGDIHAALYKAYTQTHTLANTNPKKVFRDITVGSNGAGGNKGADPSVKAQVGYDTASGLGGVLWSALTPFLLP